MILWYKLCFSEGENNNGNYIEMAFISLYLPWIRAHLTYSNKNILGTPLLCVPIYNYVTYIKLYHNGVVLILNCCSSEYGYCNLDKIGTVQNRALRLFLGVHIFSPNFSINADMGWIPSKIRRHTEILRMWNRIVKMEYNRLMKRVSG